jgi:hypothetical protein
MSTPANSSPDPASPLRTSWHIALLGGLKHGGRWRMPANYVSIAIIGGVELDLRDAELEAPEVRLTKVSVIGGVDVIVPPSLRVEVLSVRLIGSRVLTAPPGPADGPVLRVRAFSIIGGVKVRAA